MNYLRGAVSAISAPYQYYKDLNPATLTGAIDVIVVKRPRQHDGQTSNTRPGEDEHELVCSPFHVRFGKWQVLRPGDKKVRHRARLAFHLSRICMNRLICLSTGIKFRFP